MIKKEISQEDFAFITWTPKQMQKLVEIALAHKKKVYQEVKEILPENRTFLNTILALDMSEGKHVDTFHAMSLLLEVSPKKEVREAVHTLLTDLSDKMVDLEFDRDLYVAVLEYVEGNFENEKKKLRAEDIKLTIESLREYKRVGFDKSDTERNEIKKLLKKIAKLSQEFSKNINDYEDYILCTKEELSGMSARYISSLPFDSTTAMYTVSLAYPHIFPFLAEAHNRKKRKILAEKNLSKGGKKNLKLISIIVSLRADLAKILGYKNHADFRTEDRMAKNSKTAIHFQDSLLKKLAPLAKSDIKDLALHAKELGFEKLEHFDIPFVATSLKKKKYDIDPELVRSFFPLENVFEEVSNLFIKLFGVTLLRKEMMLWHKDVTLYEVRNIKGSDLVGYIAFDLFPREGKFGHAMCTSIREIKEVSYQSNEMVTPIAVVVCNFPIPQKKGKSVIPSLLSIGEIETLYHECGHALHSVLSTVKLASFAGTNVAWDFVETPSQFMENFVWNKTSLKNLSSHFETGEKLSDIMIEKILGAKKFQSAYAYTRQIIQGKVDMDLHTGKNINATDTYIALFKKYLHIDLPKEKTLFPAAFGHLVGYDAGYYSYLWAYVYAQDAYSLFVNAKDLHKVGMRWRKEVLERGSEIDEMELLTNFLGRAPREEAFLKEVIG